MKRQALAKINLKQKAHDWRITKMIEMIDKIEKAKAARDDDDVMSNHFSHATSDGERVWTF